MHRTILILLFATHILSAQTDYSPGEIEIIRDEWGVPHISAPTDAQVSYGLA